MNDRTGLSIQRVLPAGAAARWPLHGAAASRALEHDAARHLPPHTLMQRAGLAVSRLARALAPHAPCVHILAGPGNNGGDGLEAAMWLRRAGHDVRVTALADLGHLPADASASLARAREAGVSITTEGLPASPGPQDLVIDALLGLGVSRPPEGSIAQAIAAINDSPCLRLAVDLPSGLPSDNGQPASSFCVRAHHTLSLLSLKPGLFTARGRDHAGDIWFCDLGVDAQAAAADAWLAGDVDAIMPPRHHAQHKGSFGDVVVVGGAPGMTGAALLAARSALRRGAGRVFVQLLDAAGMAVDPTAPELMFRREIDWQGGAGDLTVVCGCGGGDAVRAVLPAVLSRAPRLVLDADALNAVAIDPALQALLEQRRAQSRATVLTPHPLEAARLLGCRTTDVQADRLAQARALARRYGAVVLLKGSGSVIAAPDDGPVTINPTGNARLATAGTGDVLAGWIGALWAQGATAGQAAIAAAFQHGAAAESWAPPHVAGSL